MTLDLEPLKGWIGRTESSTDVVTPRLTALFRATLDPHLAPLGEDAPLGIHWCLAPPEVATSDLGSDGHAARGGFLPPVPLPRRMWAGGEIAFFEALRIGDSMERRSTVTDLRVTEGRSGPLCFVTVQHEVSTEQGLAIRERQDIVYRDAPSLNARPSAPPKAAEESPSPDLTRMVDPSPALLFRYSALTFNSHRIHYDQPYATEIEGYPGLVVHGPLQATLLLNVVAALRGRAPRLFRYRGVSPLFAGTPFGLCGARTGQGATCWSAAEDGTVAMKAEAEW